MGDLQLAATNMPAANLSVVIMTSATITGLLMVLSSIIRVWRSGRLSGIARQQILARRALISLTAYCVLGTTDSFLLMGTALYGTLHIPIPDDDIICTQVLAKLHSMCYVFVHGCACEFYYTRMLLMDTGATKTRLYKLGQTLAWLGTKIVFFGMPILPGVFWEHSRFTVEGVDYCVPDIFWPITIAFLLLEVGLSSLYLALFIVPLLEHYRTMKASGSGSPKSSPHEGSSLGARGGTTATDKMASIIKNNAFFATIQMSVESVSMLFLAVVASKYPNRHDLETVTHTYCIFDVLLNLGLMCTLSSVWQLKTKDYDTSNNISSQASQVKPTRDLQDLNEGSVTSFHGVVPEEGLGSSQR